jgi:hypothetical protein
MRTHGRPFPATTTFRLAAILGLLLVLADGGCRATSAAPSVTIRPRSGAPIRVAVELATTPDARSFGLMYRKALAPGAGMLFVFPKSETLQFWMRNTQISLDILFLDERGRIVRMHERTEPLSERLLPSDVPARFVLEVAGGFAAEHGVSPGDVVDLGTLAATPAS